MDGHASRWVGLLVATLLAISATLPAATSPVRPLTDIQEIRQLTREAAERESPVVVRAVVTLNVPDLYLTFIQGRTGAIFLDSGDAPSVNLAPGDRVEVRGVSGAGLFAPVIVAHNIRVIGPGLLPSPLEATPGEWNSGTLDSRYVELSGVAHGFKYVERSGDSPYKSLRLTLLGPAGWTTLMVLRPGEFDPAKLIGAFVRASGPVVVKTNQRRQLVDQYVAVQSPEDLKIVRPEAVDPWRLAPTRISDLLRFDVNRRVEGRVRVRGTVTLADEGHYVFIQDGSGGLQLQTNQRLNPSVGSVIEAVGFPSLGGYAPVLSDSLIRITGATKELQPAPAKVDEAIAGKEEGLLIRLKGKFAAQFHDREHQVLWLESGNRWFAAILSGQPSTNALDNLPEDSEVELTGVCHTLVRDDSKEPVGFRLWLRNTSDVRVIKSVPWMNKRRLLGLCGGALLVALVAIAGNLNLRRRVRRQTGQIEEGALFERDRSAVLEMVGRNETLDCILDRLRTMVGRQLGVRCVISLQSGGVSVWSAPIVSGDESVLGSLALPREPQPTERQFIDNVARLAALAIEHRQFYERLTRLSQHDALTGLPNRRLLDERLQQAVAQASRYRHRVACLYIDLDGFKQINDTMGHRMGDLVLRFVADRIRDVVREADTVSRLGGDEFCVVMPRVDHYEEARIIAQRLLDSIREPLAIEAEIISLSSSIGISYFPENGSDALTLQRNADAAMYRAKNGGKNRVCAFGAEEWAEIPGVLT